MAVNAWWQAQSAAQQARFIADCPALVGSLDGVPAVARDTANRNLLNADISSDQSRVSSLTAQQQPLEARINQLMKQAPPRGVAIRFPTEPQLRALADLKQAQDQLAQVNHQLSTTSSQLAALEGLAGKLAEGGTNLAASLRHNARRAHRPLELLRIT